MLTIGKQFEREVLTAAKIAIGHELIEHIERTPDGMKPIRMITHGRDRGLFIAAKVDKTSADFTGHRYDGKIVYIEAKATLKKSVSVETPTDDPNFKGKHVKGQIAWHQLQALLRAWNSGAVGLLVVRFDKHGVYALNGVGLAAWRDDGDSKGNSSSISLKHFQEFGMCLGPCNDWRFTAECFQTSHERTNK